jgi:hypothetical protein
MSDRTDDRVVLAATERLLREHEHVSADEVLAALGWDADRKLPLMRAMKRLIDDGQLVGKVLTGDATTLEVMVTDIAQKGLTRLGL